MASFNNSLLFCSSDSWSNALPLPYQAFDEFGLISIRASNDLRADVGFWELIVSIKKQQNEQTTLGYCYSKMEDLS